MINYKQNNDLLMQQLSLLKGEIKNYKQKLDDLENFNGRISNYDDFKSNILKILSEYKPKKREQEETVKKLKDHFAGISDEQSDGNLTANSTTDKKKGFLSMFSKKNNK